jgi:hypothetical protein
MIIGTFTNLPAAVNFEGKSATNIPSMTGCHLNWRIVLEASKLVLWGSSLTARCLMEEDLVLQQH